MDNKERQVKLTDPIKRRWRVQQANKNGANMVSYISARDVATRLDDVFGFTGWSNEFTEIKGNLFCRITLTESGVYREDVGTPSNIEKQKGEASDAFKRAAVHFGIGRDLYNEEIVKLPVKEWGGKYYPVNKAGKFLKGKELDEECEKLAK